jgi:hypothetical protein
VKEDGPHKGGEAQIVEELTRLLGHAPVDWSAEALTHNTYNTVTAGIWRVRAGSASMVLKVISPGGEMVASEEWSPSEVPSHWNYWEREALAYESGITGVYSETGISGPRLLASFRRPNGEVALWLVDVSRDGAVAGTSWSLGDYRRFARSLGCAQGRIVVTGVIPGHPWLTRMFLRDYVLSKQTDRGILYSDEAWQRPPGKGQLPGRAAPGASLPARGARVVLLPYGVAASHVVPPRRVAEEPVRRKRRDLLPRRLVIRRGRCSRGRCREPSSGLCLRPILVCPASTGS